MGQGVLIRVINEFFKRTTLHGFKYLTSKYNYDRVLWVLVCCASTCCAGVLCAVLWERFLQQPAVLMLQDSYDELKTTQGMPLVIICPSPDLVAKMLFDPESMPNNTRLPMVLTGMLKKKSISRHQARLFDSWLKEQETTLAMALLEYSPNCQYLVKACRWQGTDTPCSELFKKQLTAWGACCVLNPESLQIVTRNVAEQKETSRLDLALQCSNISDHYGCQLFTMYDGEDGVQPQTLQLGQVYMAHLAFTAIINSDSEAFEVDDDCVSQQGYSRSFCMTKCLEMWCGCSDPLGNTEKTEEHSLPPCPIERLSCLRLDGPYENKTCACQPPCKKYHTDITLQNNALKNSISFDPIYVGLDNLSTVVHIRVRLRGSKMLTLLPTESWLTLLSSLGGIFNMFLGVGLFSALELIFLTLVELPNAIRKSSEMEASKMY